VTIARSIALIAILTALSGLGDAQGFIHAGKVWQDGRFIWMEAIKCAAAFQFGTIMYWLALRSLNSHGIVAVEIQTLFWFGVTIVGVALFSGQYLRWPVIDQVAALGVLAGIGWLLFRASHLEVI
jgi:hypothetical protein